MAKQLGGHSASLPVTVLVPQDAAAAWLTELGDRETDGPVRFRFPLFSSPGRASRAATCRPGGDESHSHPTRLTRLLGGQLSPGEGALPPPPRGEPLQRVQQLDLPVTPRGGRTAESPSACCP